MATADEQPQGQGPEAQQPLPQRKMKGRGPRLYSAQRTSEETTQTQAGAQPTSKDADTLLTAGAPAPETAKQAKKGDETDIKKPQETEGEQQQITALREKAEVANAASAMPETNVDKLEKRQSPSENAPVHEQERRKEDENKPQRPVENGKKLSSAPTDGAGKAKKGFRQQRAPRPRYVPRKKEAEEGKKERPPPIHSSLPASASSPEAAAPEKMEKASSGRSVCTEAEHKGNGKKALSDPSSSRSPSPSPSLSGSEKTSKRAGKEKSKGKKENNREMDPRETQKPSEASKEEAPASKTPSSPLESAVKPPAEATTPSPPAPEVEQKETQQAAGQEEGEKEPVRISKNAKRERKDRKTQRDRAARISRDPIEAKKYPEKEATEIPKKDKEATSQDVETRQSGTTPPVTGETITEGRQSATSAATDAVEEKGSSSRSRQRKGGKAGRKERKAAADGKPTPPSKEESKEVLNAEKASDDSASAELPMKPKSFTEEVAIPSELASWCNPNNGECMDILKTVIETTGATEILCDQRNGKAGKFQIDAPTEAAVHRAGILLSTHLRQQSVLQRLSLGAKELNKSLEEKQREVELGLRQEFSVDREAIGWVIGRSGENINRVYEKTGVERIVIDKEQAIVRVVGKSREAVEQARALLDFQVKFIPLSRDDCEWLRSYPGAGSQGRREWESKLREVQHKSEAALMRVMEPVEGADGGVKIIGLQTAVDTAELLLRTELQYKAEIQQLSAKQRQLRQEINKFESKYFTYRRTRNEERGPGSEEASLSRPESESRQRSSGRRRRAAEDEEEEDEEEERQRSSTRGEQPSRSVQIERSRQAFKERRRGSREASVGSNGRRNLPNRQREQERREKGGRGLSLRQAFQQSQRGGGSATMPKGRIPTERRGEEAAAA